MPDIGTTAVFAAATEAIAVVVCLVIVLGGVYSLLSGRDFWPKAMRNLRRRTPVSEQDWHLHGASVMLRGAGGAIIMLSFAFMSAPLDPAFMSVGQFQTIYDVRFFVLLIGAATYLVCLLGANRLSEKIQYIRRSSEAVKTTKVP